MLLHRFTDVFVVGGGPAGLAAAIAARQRGFDVTVADGACPPIDKSCGEGIMPDGVAAARALGIHLEDADAHRFAGIRFVEAPHAPAALFPRTCGLGIRRTVLHQLLTERASAAGVRLLWGTAVRNFDEIRARWIIGADGGQSHVRRWAGLDASIHDGRRYGFRRHYQTELWTEYMELHWSDRCQLYITPVAASEVCVALLSDDPAMRLDRALPMFPKVVERLSNARSTIERGGISASRRLRHVARERVALVGDASGSVDAVTGEGLCILFQQARSLASGLEHGDLSRYETDHRRIVRRAEWMASALLLLARNKTLRKHVFRALEWRPQVFGRLLAIHIGEPSLG